MNLALITLHTLNILHMFPDLASQYIINHLTPHLPLLTSMWLYSPFLTVGHLTSGIIKVVLLRVLSKMCGGYTYIGEH